jgi:hypothetical protein
MTIMEQDDALTLLEGLRDIIITEATQPESPRDFTVLLCHRFTRRKKRAERVEADEQVLLRHGLMDF